MAKNIFDEIAEKYDSIIPNHVMDHYHEKRSRFISSYASNGAKILDVGCGTGVLGKIFVDSGFKVFGVDASSGMLKIAHDRGIKTYLSSSTKLPFSDSFFDITYTVAVLHHIADKKKVEKTIKEMVRVTKSGGTVIVTDHNPLNPYWPIIMKKVPHDIGIERLVSLKEIINALREFGNNYKVYRTGFLPDFIPEWLMPFGKSVEALLEKLPLVNMLAAHNVVVFKKVT